MMNKPSESQPPQPTFPLKQFEILIGTWAMVGKHPHLSSAVHGHSTFEWLVKDSLLIWHFDWEEPSPPNAVSVIGGDDSVETCSVLYSDERGVRRVYKMSLEGSAWKMWRESEGFSQRMTGTFSEDRNMIMVHGELSRDGSTWEQDLDVTYTRTK